MDVIVEPDEGMAAEIGEQLLKLADSPLQVGWVSWPKAGFKVPEELALKLKALREIAKHDTTAEEEAEPPKRRGRPRKTETVEAPVLGTDDTEKEG